MSEGTAKKVTCKGCNEKVPSGKFCLNCGNRINTEQDIESTDGEPRPPLQVSDASSLTSSQSGTSQQNRDTPDVPPTNSGSHQSNKVPVPEVSTVTSTSTSTSTVVSSSYAGAVESPQQNVQQNQHSSSPGDVTATVHSDPSQDIRAGRRDARRSERSRPANGAPGRPPENGGNSARVVRT